MPLGLEDVCFFQAFHAVKVDRVLFAGDNNAGMAVLSGQASIYAASRF